MTPEQAYIEQQSIERDAKRWRMLCKQFYLWDRPRPGECGTFDFFPPCKTPSDFGNEHIIHPKELAEILDGFIAEESK
jgi:hypothetical protein